MRTSHRAASLGRACRSHLYVLAMVAGASSPLACGGRVDERGGCAAESACADAGVPSDATSDRSRADQSAQPVDAGAARDASVDAPPQDATTQDVGSEDAAVADGGGAATEAALPSTAPCLTGGNVLWLQANPASFWSTGTEVFSDAAVWPPLEEVDAYYFVWDGVYVQATAADAGWGETWTLQLNTWALQAPLETGVVYPMVQGNLIGYLRTCDATTGLTGQFRVDEFEATSFDGGTGSMGTIGKLVTFTAAFWAQCNDTTDPGPPGVLQGCVHYQQ